jgi:hypothetical protein
MEKRILGQEKREAALLHTIIQYGQRFKRVPDTFPEDIMHKAKMIIAIQVRILRIRRAIGFSRANMDMATSEIVHKRKPSALEAKETARRYDVLMEANQREEDILVKIRNDPALLRDYVTTVLNRHLER